MNEKVLNWMDEQDENMFDSGPIEVPEHLQGGEYSAECFSCLMGAFE